MDRRPMSSSSDITLSLLLCQRLSGGNADCGPEVRRRYVTRVLALPASRYTTQPRLIAHCTSLPLVQYLSHHLFWQQMADTMSLKKELRKRIAAVLKATGDGEISDQSARLAANVCALPEFQRAAAVSVYLHMPKEVSTTALLEAAFAANKIVYVPKITGKQAEDMCMVQAQSLADILAFPKV